MATVAAIFDDSVALGKAISALQNAGLGDDIVDVDENRDADTAPEQTDTSGDGNDVMDDDTGVGVVAPLGGAVGGATGGGSGMQGTTPLMGGLFGGDEGVSGPLSDLGDEGEPFRLAAERGGKLVVLKTDDVETAITTLQRAGAQQVYDPR